MKAKVWLCCTFCLQREELQSERTASKKLFKYSHVERQTSKGTGKTNVLFAALSGRICCCTSCSM